MVSRRDVLKGLGALALAPFAGRAAKTIPTATKVVPEIAARYA